MSLDPHPIALIAAGELAKAEQEQRHCAVLVPAELAERVGMDVPTLLAVIADAVEAGRFRVTAIEIGRAK